MARAYLIRAEGALAAGDATGLLGYLNQARATFSTGGAGVGGITPPAALAALPAGQAARVDLLFKERAYDLWLTGHQLGDMRRLIKFYGRDANTVFPVGDYSGGGTYGTDVNLPIPTEELNNRNYTGQCNRAAP